MSNKIKGKRLLVKNEKKNEFLLKTSFPEKCNNELQMESELPHYTF